MQAQRQAEDTLSKELDLQCWSASAAPAVMAQLPLPGEPAHLGAHVVPSGGEHLMDTVWWPPPGTSMAR
eukprot:10649091-Lingulodinium_polyedra.AAC.1